MNDNSNVLKFPERATAKARERKTEAVGQIRGGQELPRVFNNLGITDLDRLDDDFASQCDDAQFEAALGELQNMAFNTYKIAEKFMANQSEVERDGHMRNFIKSVVNSTLNLQFMYSIPPEDVPPPAAA